MNRSRSCALFLAASAAIGAISPLLVAEPATTPASNPAAPTTLPATTQSASAPATTEAAATQLSTTSPATTQAADATQPTVDDKHPAAIRLNFRDTPLDTILEHLSQDAGFSIVRDAPVDVRVTVMSIQPLNPAEAVTLLNAVLSGNGLVAIQNGRTLHIVAREKAKKGNLPVHFGNDPAAVESTDELITQVIPVHNVEAVKLRQDLTPLVGTDADMTANAGSNAIVMTDTSANVRRIVQIVSILDKREGTTSELKIIALKNANAQSAAKLVLAIFRPEEPRTPKDQQPQPQPARHEGMLLGTGIDQALHGGKVTAAADERTNSVVVAAPSETLKAIEAMLKEIDENPASVATPAIKTFHLKVADAQAVARALRAVFQQPEEPAPGQSQKVATDEAIHSHVTVVYEPKTNTLIITAPPAAMMIVEALVKDVDQETPSDAAVRSFPLKFADAVTTAKVIQSVFVDPNSGQSRVGNGPKEKVSATADARTNTVFVTATSEAMKIVEKTIHDLDASPTAGSDVKFFHLKQADADTTAKLILNFFKPAEGVPNEKRPADAVHVGVNAVADSRTNTVAVTAPPEAMAVVEQIVREVENSASTAFEIETFTLKNADASAAAKLLGTVFQPDQGAGAKPAGKDQPVKEKVVAAADDRTNTVVVTAPAETLKVIEGVIKLLDANPIADAQIQVFTLKNADAEVAGDLLNSIFAPKALQTTGSASASPKAPGAMDAARKLGWISTSADERTNTLIVTATPMVLKAVTGIIQQIDSNPGSQETFFMYRLRNGQAANLMGVLNQLFGNTQLGGNANANAAQNGQRQGQQVAGTAGNSSFTGGGPRGLTPGSSVSAGGTGIGARRGTITGAPAAVAAVAPQLSAGSTRVISELSGQVYVVADPDTNALLVTTATRYEKEVRAIITELDRPVPQVLIKVLVAEVTHDNSADWGTDFSVLNRRPSGNGDAGLTNLGNAASAATNGGLLVSVVEKNINLTLHALATEGKLDVLSRPYILASDNQLASITVGQEVPFITNTQITDTGQQINTIQYQDIGIILNVTPHINPEGLVILDVAPEISQLSGNTVPISAGVAAPVIEKRSAQSRVGIRNGETIVIGGLMQDNKTLTVSKVPILGDIPFIGELFRRTQTDKSKTELLIFLTPHVAQVPDTLSPMTTDEMNGTKLIPGAVSPGTFEEHRTGMRRGATPQTQPTTLPIDPVIEFNTPATQPAPGTGPASSGPIPLP